MFHWRVSKKFEDSKGLYSLALFSTLIIVVVIPLAVEKNSNVENVKLVG